MTEKETKSKSNMTYYIMISELDEHLHPTDNYVSGLLGIVDTEEEVIKGIGKYLWGPKYVRRYLMSHGYKPFENYELLFCLYEDTDNPRYSYIALFDVKEPGERAHYLDGCGHCWVLQRKVYKKMVEHNVEPVWQKVSFGEVK